MISQLTSRGVTATGIYYYDLSIMNEAAGLLGLEEDSRYYRNLMSEVKQAYNARFYHQDKGYYDRNSQTANAISLFYGLVDEENYSKVYENLKKDIVGRNYALTSGDIGYRYLLKVLEDNGDSDLIYKMNARYDVPGYGWQLAYGATALTESWQAYGFVSNNHCMLGHLMEWFFAGLGGIGQSHKGVGYKEVIVYPQVLRTLKYVRTEYESPYGKIKCEWEYNLGNWSIEIEIPANSSGIIYLPCTDYHQVRENGMVLKELKGCQILGKDKNSLIVKVGSGKFNFNINFGNEKEK